MIVLLALLTVNISLCDHLYQYNIKCQNIEDGIIIFLDQNKSVHEQINYSLTLIQEIYAGQSIKYIIDEKTSLTFNRENIEYYYKQPYQNRARLIIDVVKELERFRD